MRIRLLGSCQMLWQDRPFDLPRRQTRAVLFRLSARLEPVPRAQLAFLLWPDIPDADARRRLTRLLSDIRASLPEPGLLQLDAESAALDPDGVVSDSDDLLRTSPTDEPAALAEAADLYRGAFMSGFALPGANEYDAWQREMARQVESHYLALLERLVTRHTATGDHAAAIRFAQRFLAADALAETMHRTLIGLYLSIGDRASAQQQYEQCALVLERELGISPLPETGAALRTAPRRSVPVPIAVQPSLDLPFTGREEALAELRSAFRRLPPGGVILIAGEPGAGKTRLMREFVLRDLGGRLVMIGGSYPGSQALPYHPLLQALSDHTADGELWEALPVPWRSELLPLFPALRDRFPDLPPALPAASGHAQARSLAALTECLRSFAARATLALCLDDLHWADESSLSWLQFLAARWSDAPLVVLATCRTAAAPALGPVRHALARAGRLVELELGGLSAEAARRLLAHLPEPLAPGLVDRIHGVTGGNPFFLLEMVRELRERGQAENPPPDLPLPPTVREAILGRAGHLTPVARQVLEAAAILDPHADEALVRAVSARSPGETVDALDELLAHQFLQPAQPARAAARLAFPHSLLPVVISRELTPWRRKLLHQRAAEQLSRLQPDNAAALARHYAEAEEFEAAVACFEQAAAQAATAGAYETALELVERGLELLPSLAAAAGLRLALLRKRLALRRILVRLDGWQADADEVLRLAAAAADTDAQLDALEALLSLYVLRSNFPLMEETAHRALALARLTGNRRAEARIQQGLGWHLADALGRSREGVERLREAVAIAESSGATDILYAALCDLAFALRAEGQCEAARASALRALALTPYRPGMAPQPSFADALRELGEADAYLGRWEQARNWLQPLLALYDTLNDPWNYGAVLHNYGLYSAAMGQHRDAVDSMRRLVALSESVGLPPDSDYGVWHRAGLARALLAAGEVAEAGALLAGLRTGALAPGRPYLAWVRAAAEHRMAVADPHGALDILQPAVEWWRGSASPHDADVLLLLARAALAAGDQDLAQQAVGEAAACLEPTDMRRYRLGLYATRYRVSGAAADREAARAELEIQASWFCDAELRAAFLHDVPLHRQIASG